MPTFRGGRHENGQNFLTDTSTIDSIVSAVDHTTYPIVEIGPGNGALTRPLLGLNRPLTAVEIDGRAVARLRGSLPAGVELVHADFVRWRLPTTRHVIVGNLPFHLTTAILRKLLHCHSWEAAVLVVQWEVARRRAGVGGASMMTAQWWPWYEFTLHRRVSRRAFHPEPTVDGGLLVMTRRPVPLISPHDKAAYRQFVHTVFTSKGRGVAGILTQVVPRRRSGSIRRSLTHAGVRPNALPKDLSAEQWVSLFEALGRRGPRH